jgi:hypothetical protein
MISAKALNAVGASNTNISIFVDYGNLVLEASANSRPNCGGERWHELSDARFSSRGPLAQSACDDALMS